MASYPASGAAEASAAGGKAPGDLAALQIELKAAKERWEDVKLGKGKKESETFPFPVWVLYPAQQPPAAKAFDVYEIEVKLLIDGLAQGQMRVEVPSKELPPQLQDKVAEAVLATWRKQIGKKAAPWGIVKTLEWIDANFAKLLSLDPDCLHLYEGIDENDASMKRYAIGPPAAPAAEEEEEEEDSEDEEDSDEEEDAEAAAMRQRIACLLLEAESGESGRKKLSEDEIERRKKEAEEMGTNVKTLSKKEREEQAKPKAGKRLAKTGQKCRKFDGEGAVSKEDKKKKNTANVQKRFGL